MLEHIFLLSKLWLVSIISTPEIFSLSAIFTTKEENFSGKTWPILLHSAPFARVQTSDLWLIAYQIDGYEQLMHLFFAFETSLDLHEMYPDILFVDYTYKTNKYNMPLCLFSGVTAYNKSFYIGFAFLWHEDKDSYVWVMTQVKELYTRVGQEDGTEVVLPDKKDALISNLHELMPAAYHMLCVWHINKTFKPEQIFTFLKNKHVSVMTWSRGQPLGCSMQAEDSFTISA